MKKDSKQRLFEVTARLDKTFKPRLDENKLSPQHLSKLNEMGSQLTLNQYFKTIWSKDSRLIDQIINDPKLFQKYGEYLKYDDNQWDSADFNELTQLWNSWNEDNNTGLREDDKQVNDEFFEITSPVNSEDAQMFVSIINQGIDSHLEGFTQSKFDTKDSTLGKRYHFNFHKTELPILLRRLRELGTEEAMQWADDIENNDVNINEIGEPSYSDHLDTHYSSDGLSDANADRDSKEQAENLYELGVNIMKSMKAVQVDDNKRNELTQYANDLRQQALDIASSLGWGETELPPYDNVNEINDVGGNFKFIKNHLDDMYIQWFNPNESEEYDDKEGSYRVTYALDIPKSTEGINDILVNLQDTYGKYDSHGVEGNPGGMVSRNNITEPQDMGDFYRVFITIENILDI